MLRQTWGKNLRRSLVLSSYLLTGAASLLLSYPPNGWAPLSPLSHSPESTRRSGPWVGGRQKRGVQSAGGGREQEGKEGRPGDDWLGYARQLPAKNKREQAAGVLGVGAPTRRAPSSPLREDAPTSSPWSKPGGARGFSEKAGRAPRN